MFLFCFSQPSEKSYAFLFTQVASKLSYLFIFFNNWSTFPGQSLELLLVFAESKGEYFSFSSMQVKWKLGQKILWIFWRISPLHCVCLPYNDWVHYGTLLGDRGSSDRARRVGMFSTTKTQEGGKLSAGVTCRARLAAGSSMTAATVGSSQRQWVEMTDTRGKASLATELQSSLVEQPQILAWY